MVTKLKGCASAPISAFTHEEQKRGEAGAALMGVCFGTSIAPVNMKRGVSGSGLI